MDTHDIDDATVEAVGKLTEALETTDRARGHLYSFHQLTGGADLQLGEACELLRKAGHDELSAAVAKAMVSVVATMALLVMATVLAFGWSGGIA